MLDLRTLDTETKTILLRHGFDTIPFAMLAARLLGGGLDPQRNRLTCEVALPPEGTLTAIVDAPVAERERLYAIGQQAIDAGEVGIAVLNGGMATRFGGVPKGAATAVAGRSFLDLKLSQVARAGKGRCPVLLMNSFATEVATATHLKTLCLGCEVRSFSQLVSLRLTPGGELFRGADGALSLHAPGHGDFPYALKLSGQLERFRREGGKWLTLSNVDNLGASLDPLIIGAHIAGSRPMTVELVRTYPGDVGGFPALVNGRVTIVEAFRIPAAFDAKTIPVFNTNTFVFDAAALERDIDLDWFAVSKNVDGQTAVQFERLVGQLTDHLETTWLVVPREGRHSRFLPIKVPSDLVDQAEILQVMLESQGVL